MRLSYELNTYRQAAVDREVLEALTTKCDEQNEELSKLREELGELPGLKEKVARCDDLKSRLLKCEQWRERALQQLESSVGNLDKVTGLSATLGHGISDLVDAYNKFDRQTQFLTKQVEEDVAKFNELLAAAKVHKLRSERRARVVRDWFSSDDPEAETFLDRLTQEMMDSSALISFEQFRLAAEDLGLDFKAIKGKAMEKRDDALANLKRELEKESAVLTDAAWDAKEKEDWLRKVAAEAEERALSLDLEKLTLSPLPMPEIPRNMAVSQI